jgi:hypothetical protein
VIAADGEYQASTRLADAARVMADTPGALQLRLLQTVSDVASDQNSTLVMPLPVELLRFFENATGTPSGDRSGAPSIPQPRPAGSVTPGQERSHTDGDEAGKRAVTTDPEAGPR